MGGRRAGQGVRYPVEVAQGTRRRYDGACFICPGPISFMSVLFFFAVVLVVMLWHVSWVYFTLLYGIITAGGLVVCRESYVTCRWRGEAESDEYHVVVMYYSPQQST